MFDKKKFAQILKNINETYNSQRDFSKKSEINRTYLSQYMNMKLDEPPKPKTLEKLANSSHNIVSYNELMKICGYIDDVSDEKMLFLYNNLNDLEKKYDNRKKKLNFEELQIFYDLFEQVLPYLSDGYTTPETFEPYEILNGLDFISPKSKKKLATALTELFDYFYYTDEIKNKISNQKFQKHTEDIHDSNVLHVSPDIKFYMCPVYGQISAGQPNWAEECIEGRLPLDPDLMGIINPEEHFFLRVSGESMNKVIKNGAFALIHKQDLVEDGEIAVVLVNGYDATLKKFTRQGDMIILEPQSNDDSFKTQVYDKNTPIKILGKYVGKMEINK